MGNHTYIGRRPVLAVGNSSADFEMLEWTTAGEGARLGLLLHHAAAAREWAYDRGRIVVSMKNDWRTVLSGG